MKNKKEKKAEPAIIAENISKSFIIPSEKINTLRGSFVNIFKQKNCETFKALNDISFEIKKGEFFGIIGRNGSGKSTLLKILAGIYEPDKGKIRVDGGISPFLELGVGFNMELSGHDNIYLNGSILGLSKKEIDQKYTSIVDFSELKKFMNQKLKNYSSGMQVRLAFSVAIHANKDILLMDEVLAVGDSNFQAKCLDEFNKCREAGKTVILVTHDTSTIEKYCDRALLLREGQIKKIGLPEKVVNAYISENMTDEEKRLLAEEKKKKEVAEKKEKQREKINSSEKIKNSPPVFLKKTKITEVEFLDKAGKKRNVFKTGEELRIRIHFKKYDKKQLINIGVGLYSNEGSYIFGYNTQMDDYVIEEGKEDVTLRFDSLPLLRGVYFVKVVCFGKIEERFFDFLDKSETFQIFPTSRTSKYRGIVNIFHIWK